MRDRAGAREEGRLIEDAGDADDGAGGGDLGKPVRELYFSPSGRHRGPERSPAPAMLPARPDTIIPYAVGIGQYHRQNPPTDGSYDSQLRTRFFARRLLLGSTVPAEPLLCLGRVSMRRSGCLVWLGIERDFCIAEVAGSSQCSPQRCCPPH